LVLSGILLTTMKNEYYLILAPYRTDLFWRPNSGGYTTNLAQAGIYSEGNHPSVSFNKDGLSDRGDKKVPLSDYKEELIRLRAERRSDADSLTYMIRKLNGLKGINQ
jgi:hypothetical protein